MRVAQVGVVIGVVCALAGIAGAQARPEAEKLFRDGKELMRAGKTAEACSAFEASERAEHNLATLMSLADCREKNQQYASAWVLFLRADSQTRADATKSALNATARSRAALLEPRLSYLTISVPEESRIADLLVLRDGVAIDRGEWNRAMPVDGGAHEISGKAPGHESWSTKVIVAPEGEKQSVEVPKFKELPKLVVPESADVSTANGAAPADVRSVFTPRRKLALGIAAGGVLIAGVSTGFAINANSLRSEALATCPPSSCSPQDAVEANATNDRARRRALVANTGFVMGAAAVITGAVLWWVSGPEAPAAGLPADDSAARTSAIRTVVQPLVGDVNGFAVLGRF